MHFRTGYNYDTDEASYKAGLTCTADEDMTSQEFTEECDINTIVRRFGLTGELPDDFRAPQTGDFTEVTDYQTALNKVRETEEEFMKLPARMRERFHNNPQALLSFLDNTDNREEAIRLGLLKENPPQSAPATPAATESTP